ncbi:DUF4007 family protein [Deinococcus radiopugnans]|uniref:DUF4007 family protein n=1 Tax=Deinococcus radiopugnans ATCC 19172 TaxID=585398 RepID=A0A5C4Y7X0_9DEIO|nr:DUF4007 family protein [Deinococcus radiopugnans]MBB6017421.1 hypothetical protein [Deinococcus radiopugnans ATCC 19172]TNM71957.1 DUF4007 family protein [Deinococcus radiopugnans ATCC 19172]
MDFLVDKIIEESKRGSWGGRKKPHKLILWLAVLELLDQGHISGNKIYLDAQLKKSFLRIFQEFAVGDDLPQIGPPFFHLRSSNLWNHVIKPGQEEYYASITTSGGGTKRLEQSVEYAQLDDGIFQFLSSPSGRESLRGGIMDVLISEQRTVAVSSSTRSGLMFHESFPLNRPAIAAVLQSIGRGESEDALSSVLRDTTHLGNNYVKAMPRYASCCGLRQPGKNQLTPLGQHVLAHDASLSLPATQWLMHYHLSAPQGPGPRFWHDLTLKLPELGVTFGGNELTEEVGRSVQAEQGRDLAPRSLRTCATIYAGTYTKPEGLGALHLLEESGESYGLGDPESVPPGVLAYALALYWEGQFGSVQTRNLSDLSEPGGFGSLFFLSQFALNRALRGLATEGVLELWLQAPPHQVTRPPAPAALLDGIYAL